MKYLLSAAALALMPAMLCAQEENSADQGLNPAEVDWGTKAAGIPIDDNRQFRIARHDGKCVVNYFENESPVWGYTLDPERNSTFFLVPPESWSHGLEEFDAQYGGGRLNQDETGYNIDLKLSTFKLEEASGGVAIYRTHGPMWTHVDLHQSEWLFFSMVGHEEGDERHPSLTYRFDKSISNDAAILFQACRDWQEARGDPAASTPAPEPAPPEPVHPPVSWRQTEGTFTAIVRSVGDEACAVDFIDLANERLVNLLRDTDSGNYSLSLIVGDFGAAPSGNAAPLQITTSGDDTMSFAFPGIVQNADDTLQTIAGMVTHDQASGLLGAQNISVSGNGAELVDMALPRLLRAQARVNFLNCYITRM